MNPEFRSARLIAIVCALAILLGEHAHASGEPSKSADARSAESYDDRVGYLAGCLAIKNHRIQPGTPATFVIFDIDNEQLVEERILTKRVTGKILGKTHSAERCRALSEITNGVNDNEDVSFYEVWFKGIETLDPGYVFGFGILGLKGKDTDPIDLDGNGVADSFSVCNSLEGVNYFVWPGAPASGRADLAWVLQYRLRIGRVGLPRVNELFTKRRGSRSSGRIGPITGNESK
jgi:hypothetical protein